MSTPRERLTAADQQMRTVRADTARIEEFTAWLRGTRSTVADYVDYYGSQWLQDVDDPDAPSLDIINQDIPYDVIVEHHDALRALDLALADSLAIYAPDPVDTDES